MSDRIVSDGNEKTTGRSFVLTKEIEKIGLEHFRIIGNEDARFSSLATIWDADEHCITFCNKQRIEDVTGTINRSKAAIVITDGDLDTDGIDTGRTTLLLVDQPRLVFIRLATACFVTKEPSGIHPTAIIDPDAIIDSTATIGARCILGKCSIGSHTVLQPQVVINDKVRIADHVVINPGSVIGYDGFGYARRDDGTLEKFPHFGGVVIEADVEIGSNVSIDRGTLADTIIKRGAKIDNFCHIAHNVIVGENSEVIAHAMIGGSVEIGSEAWISPSASVKDGLRIGKGSLVGLGAVVVKNVPDGATVVGNPAAPIEDFIRNRQIMKQLDHERSDLPVKEMKRE
jgi:UDP-3-O-[3-hydroxymyristoyl] glucosamine N-acyltransferase